MKLVRVELSSTCLRPTCNSPADWPKVTCFFFCFFFFLLFLVSVIWMIVAYQAHERFRLAFRQTNHSRRLFNFPRVFVFPHLCFLRPSRECACDCRSGFLPGRNKLDVFFPRALPRLLLLFLLTTLSFAPVLYRHYFRLRLLTLPLFERPWNDVDTLLLRCSQSFLLVVYLLRTWSLKFGGHLVTRPGNIWRAALAGNKFRLV